jgi:hypothetical protein
MNKLVQLFTLIFVSQSVFAQSSEKNDWQGEQLQNRPSKVQLSIFKNVEKFGDIDEEIVTKEELTFNDNGYFLTKKFEDLTKKEKDKTFIFQYNQTTFKLSKVIYDIKDWSMSANGGYITNFEWNNNLLIKKFITDVRNLLVNIYSYEYEYNNGRKTELKTYDNKNQLHNIIKFQFRDTLMTEVSIYDKEGKLLSQTKNKYDANGKILQTINYSKPVNTVKVDSSRYYYYNISHKIEKEIFRSNNQSFFYEKVYDYYPTGLIKTITKYLVSDGVNKRTEEICEFKVYDKCNNWIEQVKSVYNGEMRKFMPLYKLKREITYYN